MAEIIKRDGLKLVDDRFEFETATADPEATATSGGDAHDSPDGTQPSQRTTFHKPEDVSPEEWQRRQDAVRTLAREFDEVDHGDIREFLVGRTTRELTDEEVGQIRHDVIAHRVADITDILDEQLRSTTDRMKRARRTVRVSAPRGWLRRSFGTLDERAVGQVAAKLIQRGHEPEVVKEKVISRVKDEDSRRVLEGLIDDGQLKVEFARGGMVYGDQVPAMLDHGYVIPQGQSMEFALQMAREISRGIKMPDIHVDVPVNVGGTTKKIKRNPETGLVEEITEEPDAD